MERRFSIFIFFFGIFILLLLPPLDPDLGWQLRCGQDLWQLHRLCDINHYTILLPAYNWPSHYWLYQALLYPAFTFFGSWGLTLVASFVLTSSLLFFFLTQPFLLAPFTTLILYLFSSSVFSLGIRSQIVSFLLYSILLFLFRNKSTPKTYWIGLILVWFWTQIHGSFIVGVLFLLANFASDLFSSNYRPTKASPSCNQGVALAGSNFHKNYYRSARGHLKKFIQKYAFLIPLILLIPLTLVNPNGILIYQEAWRHFSTVKLNLLIAEWVPPTWPNTLGILTLLIITIATQLKNFTRSKIPIIIFTIGIAYLGLKARRFVPFTAITLLFYMFKSNPILSSLDNLPNRYPILKLLIFTFCFIPIIISPIYQLPKTITANQNITKNCLKQSPDSPCSAIEFLKNQPDRSPIFNRYEWGGILDWNLPEFPIFVDGRMPAWQTPNGKSPYTIYLETLQTQPGWQETLDAYNINWILISPGTFMDLLLQPNPEKYNYEEVFRESVSVIYHRLPSPKSN